MSRVAVGMLGLFAIRPRAIANGHGSPDKYALHF